MNAYELAEIVRNEPFHTNLNRNTIADFICQQADRIAELEKKQNEALAEVKTSWTAISPVSGIPKESAHQLFNVLKDIMK